jgi:hypothetical protein
MKIIPKCLQFHDKVNKGAAYTSDGFMLPCCWLDDPPVYNYIMKCGLKDESLAVAKNDSLEKIFTSDQWENFFTNLIHDPENASYMCKKKCGVGFDKEHIKNEEYQACLSIGEDYGKNN